MDYIESVLRSIGESVEPLAPGPKLDLCLVQQLEESALSSELRTIRKETISVPEISLVDRALDIEKSLDVQELAIKRLLQRPASSQKVSDKSSVPDEGTVKLSKFTIRNSMKLETLELDLTYM